MNSPMWFAIRRPSSTHATARWHHAMLALLAALLAWPAALRAQTFEKLVDFDIVATQPKNLVLASDGNLYGVTGLGGVFDSGAVIRVKTTGEVDVIASFTGKEGTLPGRSPQGRLVAASDGRLYGTTGFGGQFDQGTIFAVTLGATPSVAPVVEFIGLSTNSANLRGRGPGTLTVGADGNLYGTALTGGKGNQGVIFRVTPGALPTVATFFDLGPNTNGSRPTTPMVRGPDGNFYGTTTKGGSEGVGVIFQLKTDGTSTLLANFGQSGGPVPGQASLGGLTLGSDGSKNSGSFANETPQASRVCLCNKSWTNSAGNRPE